MASSASTEQWIFTGGSASSFTMSVFLMARASSTVLPLTHSVASDDEAIAEPQPKVLNLASSMTLVSRIDLDLQLHDVAALGRADQAGAHVGLVLVHRADVARIVVVIDNFIAICHLFLLKSLISSGAKASVKVLIRIHERGLKPRHFETLQLV